MAHFQGTVRGGRGEASRLGHSNTGIHTTARGWSLGVDVNGQAVDGEGDRFCINIGGGNGYGSAWPSLAFMVDINKRGEIRVTPTDYGRSLIRRQRR